MKSKNLVAILLVACIALEGCASAEEFPETLQEVRPGTYMSDNPADFPFPTSGYTVYIVGESHGNRETKRIFQVFLESLYQEAGLRDVILEEDQAYETEANAYVQGQIEELPRGLCLRADILGQIRTFNSNLPNDQKITIHLVDVDSPMPAIYQHLTELHGQLGPAAASIPLPSFSDFNTWVARQRGAFVEELQSISADHPDIMNGLETVSLSLDWYNLGNRVDVGWPATISRTKYAPIREDVITMNIRHVLSQLNGRPVLAFFGLFHGTKIVAVPNPPIEGFKSWAQRLLEDEVSVYSLAMLGTSGSSDWRGRTLPHDRELLNEFDLTDGTPVLSLFETYPGFEIIYTDYRTEENSALTLPADFLNLPASQIFDGLIIFKEFTPMENVCPP